MDDIACSNVTCATFASPSFITYGVNVAVEINGGKSHVFLILERYLTNWPNRVTGILS